MAVRARVADLHRPHVQIRRGREHWVATVAELERSELTQESFERRRRIEVGTLRSWIYKLRRGRRACRACRCAWTSTAPLPRGACGENLAGLYSLIATCDLHGVDPVEYLRDVLLRVDVHAAAEIDAILPHRWTPMRVAIDVAA